MLSLQICKLELKLLLLLVCLGKILSLLLCFLLEKVEDSTLEFACFPADVSDPCCLETVFSGQTQGRPAAAHLEHFRFSPPHFLFCEIHLRQALVGLPVGICNASSSFSKSHLALTESL